MYSSLIFHIYHSSYAHWRMPDFGVASDVVLQWPHSQPGQTWEARSHRPQCRPSLATFTVLGWRMGVPYK